MSSNRWVRYPIIISGVLVIGLCYYGIKKWFYPPDTKNFPKTFATPKPVYGIVAKEIAQQDEEYFQSELADRMKEKQIETKMQELRAQKEAEELEKALLDSKLEFEAAEKTRRLKILLEKVNGSEQHDPNEIYYTCKLTMVDGKTFFRKVSSSGTFEQLFDFIDTREIDPTQNASVQIPEKYILLSDFPRVTYTRDQRFCDANLTLSKKFEFKIRVEGVYEPGDSHTVSKKGLSLI